MGATKDITWIETRLFGPKMHLAVGTSRKYNITVYNPTSCALTYDGETHRFTKSSQAKRHAEKVETERPAKAPRKRAITKAVGEAGEGQANGC